MKIPVPTIIFTSLLAGARLLGQTAATQPTAIADAAAIQQALLDARSVAQAGNTAGAESILEAVNRSAAGTPGWESETAGNLVQLAFQSRQDGNHDVTSALATLALKHLSQCITLATAADSSVAGTAWEMSGFIQARFFGDLKTAEADYRQALQVSPSLTSAQAALNRLVAAQLSEQQKLQAWRAN